MNRPLSEELALLDRYWRAANYLSVGQIYLRDNPLLREPLTLAHVKPRLLGHWGTSPGLSSSSTACTSRSTATTCPRCGTGNGPPERRQLRGTTSGGLAQAGSPLFPLTASTLDLGALWYSCSLYWILRTLMPSISAALLVAPPVASSVLTMA